MKKSFDLLLVLILALISKQSSSQVYNAETDPDNSSSKTEVEWERPFNFFAAAGASYMYGNHYSVAISPIDHTVQFEKTFPILTRFSLGIVWNPLEDKSGDYMKNFLENKEVDPAYKAERKNLAIALLLNVFQLSYSNNFDVTSPIDLGFGIGYRNSNFLIMGTFELTPLRTPRSFFIDQYLDKNLPMVMAGSTEPVQNLDPEDNSLFINKIYPSFGIKMAYSFTKQK